MSELYRLPRLLFQNRFRCLAVLIGLCLQNECLANQVIPSQSAPLLSKNAQISIITCGAGPDLYEAFGHTALRIKDPEKGMDLVFNYGVFDFDQENFYGNFARGYMRYMLGVSTTEDFLFQYRYHKRSVREQVLNLDSAQRQSILNYLDINLLPKNREYYYNYFDNNCSTKIVELLDSALHYNVRWNVAIPEGPTSYRNMIHRATVFQPWGRLGIDIGLGALIDKPLTGAQLDFLPDYVEADLNRAQVFKSQIAVPLVLSSSVLYESDAFYGNGPYWMHPGFVFSILLFISILLYWKSNSFKKTRRVYMAMLILLAGLVGWVDLLIWMLTNHRHAAWNYNLAWANPIFLFLGVAWLFHGPGAKLQRAFFLYLSTVVALWFLVPQELNTNILPFVLACAVGLLPARISPSKQASGRFSTHGDLPAGGPETGVH